MKPLLVGNLPSKNTRMDMGRRRRRRQERETDRQTEASRSRQRGCLSTQSLTVGAVVTILQNVSVEGHHGGRSMRTTTPSVVV